MKGEIRIWIGSEADSAILARLHALTLADAWPEPAFAALLERDGVTVFLGSRENSSEAEGFALIRAAADEAEILTICVVLEARRAGLGSALLGSACRHLQKCGVTKMFLEVSVDNVAALTVYRRFGFLTVGQRAAYYQAGHEASDALVMRKLLDDMALLPSPEMDYKGS